MDPLILRALLVLCTALTIGCQLPYLMKSSYNQLSLLSSRVDVQKVLNDPSTSDEEKRKLILSQKVKEFSVKQLHLKDSKNYTSYVKLNRDAVTYVVNASPKWELKHYEWSFPIVGSMPYKGFFNLDDAKSEETDLKKMGLDTYLRGVSAYSTLGWFNDPLLSSMLKSEDHDLVNTIIHETVHLTLYIKNSADFNERMAVFLGNKGTEIFYLDLEGAVSPTLQKIKDENEDQKIFSAFITHEIKELEKWYQSSASDRTTQDDRSRQERLNQILKKFENDIRPLTKSKAYKNFAQNPLNNARLMLFKTYDQDLSDFEELFALSQQDFKKFMSYCKELEGHPKPEIGLKDLNKRIKAQINKL